jgi:hypothetical protein
VSRAARPAAVRFYFDADLLGLAKVVAALRVDCTYPGDPGAVVHRRRRPACPITSPAAKDRVWIPEVTRRGWLILTRDSRVRDHPAEIAAVEESGARLVTLAAKEAGSVWAQLELLMCQWRAIEGAFEEPGPFILRATRTALTAVPLD